MRSFQVNFIPVLLLVVMLGLFGKASQAATPSLINYQGSLATSGGVPVPDGSYLLALRIYNVPSGGSPLWSENQSVNTVNGQFAVLLGSVTPITDALFSDTVYYLGIGIGMSPEMTPRTRLVTVPYAFRVSTINGSTGGAITGDIKLDFSSPTSGNIYKGGSLFMHDFGPGNTFAGILAGNFGAFGNDNSGFGEFALNQLDFGQRNVAFGTKALRVLSSGSNNVAVGAYALETSPAGSNNVAVGTHALTASLVSNNTAVGYATLTSNTLGANNVAVGTAALLSNSNASDNTAVGYSSLTQNSTGISNSAHGSYALYNNTTASFNSASGYYTLFNTTTGQDNTATGAAAMQNNSTGGANAAFGRMTLITNTTGSYNTAIGFNADVASNNLTNATAIGALAVVNSSNKIRLGAPSVSVIEGSVAYTFTSDENQKENFQPVDGEEVLKKISGLSATSWNYIGQDPSQFRHYGPMAQEFYAAFGHDGIGTSGTSTTINSGDMAGVMLIAIQTLEKRTAEVETLKETITALQEEIAALKTESAKKK